MTALAGRFDQQRWPAPDRRLLTRIASGDETAMRELAARLEATLYAIAYGILFDQQAAEQVVGEVMHRIWCDAHYIAGTLIPVRRWLARMTRLMAAERASQRLD